MRIAVTGASGRIGNVVVRKLLEAGHTVRVLQRRDSHSLAGLDLKRVSGDLFNPTSLASLCKDCAILIHLAAVISVQGGMGGKVHRTNVDGTRAVMKAALEAGVRRVIHFSSIHAFQQLPLEGIFDETRLLAFHSKMAYDRSKAEAMDFALRFAKENGLEIVVLCPTSVLGPFDFEPSLSGQMLINFYHQKIPTLVPGGFDWCDVRDIADATVSAIDQGQNGAAYLLSGQYATLLQIAAIVHEVTGKPTPKRVVPYWMLRLGLPFVEKISKISGKRPLFTIEALDTLQTGSKQISPARAQHDLDYSPRSLKTCIADAYQWFEQNKYL